MLWGDCAGTQARLNIIWLLMREISESQDLAKCLNIAHFADLYHHNKTV